MSLISRRNHQPVAHQYTARRIASLPLSSRLPNRQSTIIMPNKWRIAKEFVLQGGWKKLINPTVEMHKTAFPKNAKDLEKLGLRFDYAGKVVENGKTFHRFQVQVNAGDKIPKSWKVWREKYSKGKGTHGIVATIKVPESGTREDVAQAFDDVEDDIE